MGTLLIATILFAAFTEIAVRKKAVRYIIAAFIILWSALILENTVFSRTTHAEKEVVLQPLHSYIAAARDGDWVTFRSAMQNIALFYPLGVLFGALVRRDKKLWLQILTVLAACCLFSMGIELMQYIWKLGHVETDDVIHNTLGAGLGILLYLGISTVLRKIFSKKTRINIS